VVNILGDPFAEIKEEQKDPSPSPKTVNFFHTRSDVDSGTSAMHHTLGIGHNQAASGDHVHDGKSSRKIGTGLSLSTAGAAAGNTALNQLMTMLHSVIEFTDTHSV
jgi:hypothetical protein